MPLDPNIPLSGQVARIPDILGMIAKGQQLKQGRNALALQQEGQDYRKTLGGLMQQYQGPGSLTKIGQEISGQYPVRGMNLMQLGQQQERQQRAISKEELQEKRNIMANYGQKYLALSPQQKVEQFPNLRKAMQTQGIPEPESWADKTEYDQDVEFDLNMASGFGKQGRMGTGVSVVKTGKGFARIPQQMGVEPEIVTLGGKTLDPAYAPTAKKIGDQVVDRYGKVLWDIPKTRSEKIKDDVNARGWAQLALDEKTLSLRESPGWQKVDTAFATDYNTLVSQGGLADAVKGVDQISVVKSDLESGRNLTGSLISLLPDDVRKRVNPQSMNTQELLEEVVQRNLKAVLGAQFTEEEGKRLIARAYNPALDESINAKRVGRLLESMQGALSAKLEAISYFEENGTLRGYKSSALKGAITKLRGLNYGKKPAFKSKKRRKANIGDF